ncbi:hypothetical protein Pst134EA_021117 [Puccinia striiformis f. sp. tritici]|uniref:hypothetical protein n=1 Tax=Puccinia striiformis f. sp. tritici TaxID=168172 RepID=UPI0020084EF5|nr:hypothetical protein Pst134EA_021117 [Puccinia striiformis f. sp. tritici]KAH9457234.1 hypothetical protein Pst134EA_021117 [Puccinia striiformis f. sp. tritici]
MNEYKGQISKDRKTRNLSIGLEATYEDWHHIMLTTIVMLMLHLELLLLSLKLHLLLGTITLILRSGIKYVEVLMSICSNLLMLIGSKDTPDIGRSRGALTKKTTYSGMPQVTLQVPRIDADERRAFNLK